MSSKYLVVFLAFGLSACSSGDPTDPQNISDTDAATDTPNNQTPGNLPTYDPLIGSRSTNLSQLSGSVVTARTGNAQVRRVTGRIRHGGGKVVIDDGIYKLADDNGFDANGEAKNEGVTLKLVNPSGKYTYASLYSTSYTVGADTYTAVGAIGIGTRSEDMPSTGSASYSGDAVYAYTKQVGTGFAGLGRYDATVNFARADVDSSVTVTSAFNPFTRIAISDPAFDRIEMNNLTVSGTAYSGTNMQLLKNGAPVLLTGANTTAQVEGQFYGIANGANGAVIPDEIAGEALLNGDDGNVILSFIGD